MFRPGLGIQTNLPYTSLGLDSTQLPGQQHEAQSVLRCENPISFVLTREEREEGLALQATPKTIFKQRDWLSQLPTKQSTLIKITARFPNIIIMHEQAFLLLWLNSWVLGSSFKGEVCLAHDVFFSSPRVPLFRADNFLFTEISLKRLGDRIPANHGGAVACFFAIFISPNERKEAVWITHNLHQLEMFLAICLFLLKIS